MSSKELAREVKKTTRGAQRDVQKEIQSLDRQEKTLIADIKKAAKTNNKQATGNLQTFVLYCISYTCPSY